MVLAMSCLAQVDGWATYDTEPHGFIMAGGNNKEPVAHTIPRNVDTSLIHARHHQKPHGHKSADGVVDFWVTDQTDPDRFRVFVNVHSP